MHSQCVVETVMWLRTLSDENLIILFGQYEQLTPVESALLENEIEDRGLRITEES